MQDQTPSAHDKPHTMITTSTSFHSSDVDRTLFPMTTSRILVEHGHHQIKSFISGTNNLMFHESFRFLPQIKISAIKNGLHIRQTSKLDPVAEYFLYDFVFRNKALYRKPHQANRIHFGYRFQNGNPINSAAAYADFSSQVDRAYTSYKFGLRFDIANYFNCLYHHDLASVFQNSGGSDDDYQAIGKFLREINAGRSIDCLPQGLYPAKMMGNDFLTSIDNHHDIRSDLLLRFMDDFVLFSDDETTLKGDFVAIQEMLGAKGLYINANKTLFFECDPFGRLPRADEIKLRLLEKRRIFLMVGYDDEDEFMELTTSDPLEEDELDYILGILRDPHLQEEDAELILTVMRNHTDEVEEKLPQIISQFPNLAKNVYNFCKSSNDYETIAEMLVKNLESETNTTSYQLFWFASMLDGYLKTTAKAGTLFSKIINHKNATEIVQAKILEISENRFGLREHREKALSSHKSDWLTWAAIVGSRNEKPNQRNYLLSYCANSSPVNELFASIVKEIPTSK